MAYFPPFNTLPFLSCTMMNLPTREQGGILVVSVSGRIDHTTDDEFLDGLGTLLKSCEEDRSPLLLDFSDVDYVSSAGLRALIIASRRAKSQQGTFAIAALQPLVQEVFAISRFNLIVPCFGTVDSACRTLTA
jgi:anti-sigma B factor antagonist/stage II sporulation protein AA (anti-sigma F factor antagonist)